MKVPAGSRYFATHQEMDAATVARLNTLAYRHGRSYDSYLITEPNRQYFWSRELRGVVGFRTIGKYVKVVGGLICADQDREELLGQFLEFNKMNRLVPSVFNVADNELPLYRQFGFQPTKLGEDAIIDLTTATWAGKQFEWVRRQSNFVRRQNVVTRELREHEYTPAAWQALMAELKAISDEHVAGKPQRREMGLFVGQFIPEHLLQRRIFAAYADDGKGRIEGFIVCTPCLDGAQWAIELYRQRTDAVRGVIPYLMLEALQTFKANGVKTASLCIVPAIGCEKPTPGDSWLARTGMVFFNKYLNFIYDTQGIYHYKSRFRPTFENRYVCVYPKATLGSTLAFMRAWGILDLHLGRVIRSLVKSVPERVTLAKPAARRAA